MIRKYIKVLCVLSLIFFNVGCSKETVKELPALDFESDVEYVLAFLHAMNTNDTNTIDALLSRDAIIVYEESPEEIKLGYSSDENSHISYLLALNSRYEDIIEEKNNLNSVMTSFLYSNKFIEDIWNVHVDERTRYEFVVKDQRIELIYVYNNIQEDVYTQEYTLGGVGIEISYAEDNSKLMITQVYAGTPAAVLKLEVNDIILSIESIAIQDMSQTINEAEYRILGAVNTPVNFKIQRGNSDRIETITMTRMALEDYIPLTDEEILNRIEE